MRVIEADAEFEVAPLTQGSDLPLAVRPCRESVSLIDAFPRLRELSDRHLRRCGGILFRGFEVGGPSDFRRFAEAFGQPLLDYEFGSTPRTRLAEGLYTSTEYPPHQTIPLHNEQSYTRDWPMNIWFYCAVAARSGGETPIADSRWIYERIDPRIRDRFAERGLMYVRNYGNGLDVPWTRVFNTDDPARVEAFCRAHGIVCEWKGDGELRTRQICQAIARHPVTGEMVWFNQAHLFHVSNIEPEAREALLDVLDEKDLPRNVYYGNGAHLENSVLDEIRGVLDEAAIRFPWREGDVLMLDNMLAAHGRAPFDGPRKIVVAMAGPYGAQPRPA
ncbi:MAG: TauD/TfdA family dioxygenase [Pseudomonadota bacterium]